MRLAKRRRPRWFVMRPRDREAGFTHDFSETDWDYALSYWDDRCAICGRERDHDLTIAKDHWIPLADKEHCPGTIPSNIIPLCHGVGGCNNLKSDQNPVQYLKYRLGSKANDKLEEIEQFFQTVRKTRYEQDR